MPRKLSSATKKADAIAAKLGGKSRATKATASISNPVKIADTEIPGLIELNLDAVSAVVPKFDPGAYSVADPLAPSDSIPQVSEADFSRGMKIYDGANRALDMTSAAMDLTAKRFVVTGKQSKAIGAGIKGLTAIEGAKADYLDWQNAIEGTNQKQTGLEISRHQTSQGELAAVELKAELDEKLEQAKLRAETARAKTQQALNQLDELKASLPLTAN